MPMNREKRTVYRVQGFTCSGCAATFEKNVKALPGVTDAQVNFGASKVTVYGEATVAELEKAGAFEGLRIFPESQADMPEQTPWTRNPAVIRTAVAGVLLAAGWIVQLQSGEAHPAAVALYLASIVAGGYLLFSKGLRNLVKFQFDIHTLMTIAILGAAAIGDWGEGATVVILFAVSESLESYSMEKARRSIRSLMQLAPRVATIRTGDMERTVDVQDVCVGDLMIVRPGEKIALDGRVVKGSSAVNQAPITGESVSVHKQAGDEVYAGTLNEEGVLEVLVTKTARDTTIAKIIHLVEEAQAERAPAQAFIDRFAKWYTPMIIGLALGIALLPPLVTGGAWYEWLYRALAVLVVGCPCALVISTPVAVVTAIGTAARNGVLIKGGIHLETVGRVRAIAFDKTGTLTEGNPSVTDMELLSPLDEWQVWNIAVALEGLSRHPLAQAIVRKAKEKGIDGSGREVEDFVSLTGKGVQGRIDGTLYRMGSPALWQDGTYDKLDEDVEQRIREWREEGKTVVLLGTEQEVLAMFALADKARESAKEVIRRLRRLGIQSTVMLTGDHIKTARAVGRNLQVDDVQADLLPEEKLDWIKRLKDRFGFVAMVGDGVNDAPALAAASVGIAMGGAGSDTALETADIALMGDDLRKLPYTVKLSRKALAIIRENIALSLGLKAAALLLMVPGWLTLWLAVVADMGATLIVTGNALRLLRVKE